MIYEDYCIRLIGLGEICDKLNRNPDRYPPPIPNRKDENDLPHTWSRSVVQSILRNPKYTGYNVWGRHDKRPGHPLITPRDQWVWSPEPTHPAIVSRELFDMVEERAQKNTIAMKAGMPRRAHKQTKPHAKRVYPLRGRVRCSMCGRSMEGSHQRDANWYRCQYVYRRGPEAAALADHPKVHGIKEDRILEPVSTSWPVGCSGPDRLCLLRDGLADASTSGWEDHAAELERLDAELAKLNRSLRAQTLRLEEHEDEPSNRRARVRAHSRAEHPQGSRHGRDQTPQDRTARRTSSRRNRGDARRSARPTADDHDGRRRGATNDFPRLRRVDPL
jgi:site-specific DNA recombinase